MCDGDLWYVQVCIRCVHLETEVEPCLLPLRKLLYLLVLSQLVWVCILFPQWVLFLLLSGHGFKLFHVYVHSSDYVRDSLHSHRHPNICQAVARRLVLDRE